MNDINGILLAVCLFVCGWILFLMVLSIRDLIRVIKRLESAERKIGVLAARLDALKQAELERAADKEKEVVWYPTRKVIVRNGNESYTMEIIDTGFDLPLDFPNDRAEKEE